jgi:hypothetical protein
MNDLFLMVKGSAFPSDSIWQIFGPLVNLLADYISVGNVESS